MSQDYLNAVESLLDKVDGFGRLKAGQQAAFRASLTSLQRKVTDPQILGILAKIKAQIGESEAKVYQSQTPAEVIAEYEQKYLSYSAKQRTGFKAKLTRMANKMGEDGNIEAQALLTSLQARIDQEGQAARMSRILAKAADKLTDKPASEPEGEPAVEPAGEPESKPAGKSKG